MDDLISRQAAIDALGEQPLAWEHGEYEEGLIAKWESDVEAIKQLPSAKPKTGLWIKVPRFANDTQPNLKCQFCGDEVDWFGFTKYCGECGARLVVKYETD